MSVSFTVTVHNEGAALARLMQQLVPYCRDTGTELVIVDDHSYDAETLEVLAGVAAWPFARVTKRVMAGDFAAQKNYATALCQGDYVCQLDADETLSDVLLAALPTLTEADLYWVPRINTVDGLTLEDAARWGWQVYDGRINWPDYQGRIYRRHLTWAGRVHERIVGAASEIVLPDAYALHHPKTITRQRAQMAYYDALCHS